MKSQEPRLLKLSKKAGNSEARQFIHRRSEGNSIPLYIPVSCLGTNVSFRVGRNKYLLGYNSLFLHNKTFEKAPIGHLHKRIALETGNSTLSSLFDRINNNVSTLCSGKTPIAC